MTERTDATGSALLVLIGPTIWAAHFFSVYLAEAVLCAPSVAANDAVRIGGAVLTIAAVVALLWVRRASTRGAWGAYARPLIDLSIVAVLLTAIPLVVIGACKPAGA